MVDYVLDKIPDRDRTFPLYPKVLYQLCLHNYEIFYFFVNKKSLSNHHNTCFKHSI